MKSTKALYWLIFALSFCLPLSAQEAEPLAKHPGDSVKFQIKFDGPDADKITSAGIHFNLKSGTPSKPGQEGFEGHLGGATQASAPRTFIATVTIPQNVASGTYTLTQIDGSSTLETVSYQGGELPSLTIRVENPNTFKKPTVTVTPLP